MKKEKDNLTKTDYTKVHANYRLLFKILFESLNLSKAKVVCLYMLGHPYYYHKLQKKYPKLKIITIESPEIAKLYRQEKCYIVNITKNIASFWPKELKMKFDYIIMNPPYNDNLHIKILQEAMKLKAPIISLAPINWLQSPFFYVTNKNDGGRVLKYKSLTSHLKAIKVLDLKEVNKLFNIGLRSEIGITEWIPTEEFDTFFKFSYSKVFEILKNGQETLADYISKQLKTKNYLFFRRQMFDINDFNPKDFFEFNDKFFEKDIRAFCPIYFNTKKEMQNFINTYNSNFMLYFLKKIRPSQFVSIQLLPWMGNEVNPRTGLKGYESEWTDEDFYKFFDLTADEIKIIEDTMEKYK